LSQRAFAGINAMNGISMQMFTKDDLDYLDMATMEILSKVGVGIADPTAIETFQKAGCEVDAEKKIVKIPEYLVRESIMKCPSRVTLAARNKKNDFVVEAGKKTGNTTFGVGMYNYDYEKGTVSDSTERNLLDAITLADWCKNIDFITLPLVARDVLFRGLSSDVHELYLGLTGSSKHFHHGEATAESMDLYYKMGLAYYGGDEKAFRRRPIFSVPLCPTSPLQLHSNACGVIMKGAQYGLPINVLSMAMSGASGPVTLAGTLVVHNAEVLSGITLAQLTVPGTQILYGSSTTMFDLRTVTAPVGAPELGLISAAVARLAQYYRLPSYVAGS